MGAVGLVAPPDGVVEQGSGGDEVAPPQAAGHRHRQDAYRHGLGGSLGSGEPGAGHNQPLAKGDDDEQPVPLAEVVGADVPALGGSGRHRDDHIEQHRGSRPPPSDVTPDHTAAGHGGQAARGQQGEAAHGRPLALYVRVTWDDVAKRAATSSQVTRT